MPSRDPAIEVGSERFDNMVITGVLVQKRWAYCLDPLCTTMINLHMKALEKGAIFTKETRKNSYNDR